MKKLFLFILLSLGLSAISYAGPYDDWPDDAVCMWLDMKPTHAGYLGEAKKRRISCEGGVAVKNKTTSTSSSGNSSFTTNTGSWNDPGPLDELTIPDNWQLFKNKHALEHARKSFQDRISKRVGFNEAVCLSVVKDWGKSMELYTSATGRKQSSESTAFGGDNQAIGYDIQDCLDKFIYATQNYPGTPEYMKEILLHWAKTDAVFIPSGVKDENWGTYVYEAVQSWSSFGSYYATFYNEFNYSDPEREIVDAYIKDKLVNVNTRNQASHDHGKACDPDNLERTVEGQFSNDPRNKTDPNTCGSSVWKTTLAQLLVGLRLNDKALFKKGVENTKWQLSFFDESGIFITWAIKGSASYSYSSSIPVMLGGLTEIYASLGYDFMEHKLRNGLSVKQLMDRQYELFEDPHILDSWVKRYPHDYKGSSNLQYLQSSVEQIRGEDMNLSGFVRNLPRYIDTYRTDIGNSQEFDEKLGKQSTDVRDVVASKSTGSFQPLDPYLVYISYITEPEPEIIWDAEDKLKGEYASKWYIGNTMDNPVTFEYRGKDTLTLERGKGVFSGVFSGMGYRFPSRDERGKLKIEYKPNGEITVEGDLGIFHDNKSYPTFLEGDINSGEISGVWEEGDLIKIEITKVSN